MGISSISITLLLLFYAVAWSSNHLFLLSCCLFASGVLLGRWGLVKCRSCRFLTVRLSLNKGGVGLTWKSFRDNYGNLFICIGLFFLGWSSNRLVYLLRAWNLIRVAWLLFQLGWCTLCILWISSATCSVLPTTSRCALFLQHYGAFFLRLVLNNHAALLWLFFFFWH